MWCKIVPPCFYHVRGFVQWKEMTIFTLNVKTFTKKTEKSIIDSCNKFSVGNHFPKLCEVVQQWPPQNEIPIILSVQLLNLLNYFNSHVYSSFRHPFTYYLPMRLVTLPIPAAVSQNVIIKFVWYMLRGKDMHCWSPSNPCGLWGKDKPSNIH